jgi:hypothetical protein
VEVVGLGVHDTRLALGRFSAPGWVRLPLALPSVGLACQGGLVMDQRCITLEDE